MKISVTVTGYIDVSDDWDDGQYSALDVADYRYNDQLTAEDALQELAKKMAVYPDDVEVRVRLPEVTEPLTIEQLREMGGQPVYMPDTNCWALVTQNAFCPILTFPDGEKCSVYDWYEQVGPVYRCPPEGEEDT